MATSVSSRGQLTLPKAVREAAGIRPGDRVTVRARPEGGVVVEREAPAAGAPRLTAEEYGWRIDEVVARRPMKDGPFAGMSTDEIMQFLRGDE